MFFQGRYHVSWTPQSMKMLYFQESLDSFLKKKKRNQSLRACKEITARFGNQDPKGFALMGHDCKNIETLRV
jgi:hypothetical protein